MDSDRADQLHKAPSIARAAIYEPSKGYAVGIHKLPTSYAISFHQLSTAYCGDVQELFILETKQELYLEQSRSRPGSRTR